MFSEWVFKSASEFDVLLLEQPCRISSFTKKTEKTHSFGLLSWLGPDQNAQKPHMTRAIWWQIWSELKLIVKKPFIQWFSGSKTQKEETSEGVSSM